MIQGLNEEGPGLGGEYEVRMQHSLTEERPLSGARKSQRVDDALTEFPLRFGRFVRTSKSAHDVILGRCARCTLKSWIAWLTSTKSPPLLLALVISLCRMAFSIHLRWDFF
jgi:hypothetical protein